DWIAKAKTLTIFIYAHHRTLALMRKFTKCKDIVRLGVTRFATSFLTLQSLMEKKEKLRLMFTSDEWTQSKWAKTKNEKLAYSTVMSPSFWNGVNLCLNVISPLVKVLRLVDGDQKPSMGFLYEELKKAKEDIKTAFNNVEIHYRPIIDIIDSRSKSRLDSPLHLTAYLLNPYYFFKDESIKDDVMVSDTVFKCLEKMLAAKGCLENTSSYDPGTWWMTYGNTTPVLQKMAIKILSLTTSSSAQSWIVAISEDEEELEEDGSIRVGGEAVGGRELHEDDFVSDEEQAEGGEPWEFNSDEEDCGDGEVRFVLYDLAKPQVASFSVQLDHVDDLVLDEQVGFSSPLLDKLLSKWLCTVKSIPPRCRLRFSRVLKEALDKLLREALAEPSHSLSNIDEENLDLVFDMIKSFSRGTSCGRDGLRAQHLMDCLSGAAVAISDQLVSSITQLGGGIRPIVVGAVWRRLVSKVSGGGEAILHAVNRLIEDQRDDAGLSMLLVDFKNAFNLVDREAWYLDDGTIIGDTLVVGDVLKLIMEDRPRRGLHLNTMNNRIYRCVLCYRSGVPLFSVSKPCSACSKVFPLHPADMLLYSWDRGIDVCVDLTGSSPLTKTWMIEFVPGRAVIEAAQRISVKYEAKCADIGYGCVPFLISSFEELERDAVTLLKRIRKFTVTQDIGARTCVHIFSMINFAIAKGVEPK
nr:hypothetical protein [Tanacetum cinerariifolium]